MNFLPQSEQSAMVMLPYVESAYKQYVIPLAEASTTRGHFGHIIHQQMLFDEFTIRYHVLFINEPIVLHAVTDTDILSLHFMLKNTFTTRLDGCEHITLHEGTMQLFSITSHMHESVFTPGVYECLQLEIAPKVLAVCQKDYPVVQDLLTLAANRLSGMANAGVVAIPIAAQMFIDQMLQNRTERGLARMAVDAAAKQLLMLSLETFSAAASRLHPITLVSRDYKIFEAIKAYIMNNLDEKVTIPFLCRKFNIGKTRLQDGFRKLYDATLYDYIARLRIEKAKLLLDKGMPVNAVANEVGFPEPSNFIRLFKKNTGTTPLRYRAQASPFSSTKN
jgi:AraC-like DNA-binding protein